MSLMQNPLVKYPVYGVVGCCLLGVSPLGASLAKTVVGAYGNSAGIFVGVAPSLPGEFEEGRKLVDPAAPPSTTDSRS